MANFNNIKHEIDQNVNTNGQQAITGAILNETLKDMLDEVDDKKQDTLVAGQNITIQGNVISATGGGSGSYVEGRGIEISGNVISVAPDEIAGSGLRSDGEGHLELDPNDLPPTYAEGFGIDITTGPDVIAVDTSVIQEKLTAGSNITLSGTTISATDTTYSAGSGILIDQNNEISADTSVLQPKLTAGSGISISAQNVISATGGGGGGTTYGDGDAISIDSNDNINVLYGNGLQLDGNGALEVDTAQVASDLAGNGLQVDANGALEVDPFGMPFLPLAGGQLQDDPNNTNSTDLNITSPSSYAHIDAYTEDDPNNPGGTAYVEVYDMNGTAQYGSDGITVNGDKLSFPAGPATLATQSDLSDYLPLTGGTLNNTGQINTNLSVQSPNSDYHVNTYVPNSGSVEIEIGMSSGHAVQNPSDGDTKNLRVYKDKVDLYTYDSNTSNWRTDSLYFPKKKTGTIALDSDLAGKQDTLVSGTNIKTINGNSLLGNGDITISGGQSYTAGNGIDITSGTISVDASDLAGTGLGSNLNGELFVDANQLAGSGLQVDANGYLNVVGTTGNYLPLDGGSLQDTTQGSTQTALGVYSPQSGASVSLTADSPDPGTLQGAQAGVSIYGDVNGTPKSVDFYHDRMVVDGGSYDISYPSVSANDTLAVLSDIPGAGNGLQFDGNNDLEIDTTVVATQSDLSGYLPLDGGVLSDTTGNATTILNITPATGQVGGDTVYISSGPSIQVGSNNSANGYTSIGQNAIQLNDGNGNDLLITNTGFDDGTYTLSFPTLTQNETIATLSDISGSGSYVAGNGIDITSGTISVDETYLDSVYLPIIGGSLENTSNHTDLRVDAPNSESDNFVDILSPGTGVPSVELGTDTNTQGEVESLKFKGDADIDIKYVGDNTTYTLSFPTLTQNETIATLSDIQGGGGTSYTAGTGISISAQNVISNSAPDPGLWVAGTGTDSIRSFNSTSATGSDSISIGYHASATANNAVAVGPSAQAVSHDAVSVGGYVSAPYSIAGPGASITGGVSGYGVAFGYNAQVDNNYGVAIGNNAYSKVSGEYTIGDYNKYYNSNNSSEKVLFSVGNGSGIFNRANALEFKQNNDLYVYGVGSFDGTNAANASTLQTVLNGKQDALTAGTGISISGNVISATGGGGGGLWTSGTGTDSLVAPATITAGLSQTPAQGTGAISCGYDTNADGDYAFASGGTGNASGDYSFAANNGISSGDYSASFNTSGAYGDESFAAGTGSTAGATSSIALAGGTTLYDDSDPYNIQDAAGSVAIGTNAAANAPQAIAIGYGAVAYGQDSIAIGVDAFANDQDAIAIGSGSTAEGLGSVALSSGTATGERSTAMSSGNAVGSYSVAGGLGAITAICSSVALGFNTMTYDQNDPTDEADPQAGETALGRFNYTDQDFIFSVGCGYEVYHDPDDPDFQPNPDDPDNPDGWTETVRQNAITITTDGSIYIKGLGGYSGTAIGGAEDLSTVISNLNPL